MMPVIASFTAMAAVIWMAALRLESRSSRVITGSILGALVLWSGCQTIPFFVHSRDMTGNAHATENSLRPENAMLDAYAYLLLPLPPYFSHGKTDPMIESRLLDRSGRVVSGPKEDALAMESRGVRKIRMTTAPLANSTTWFEAGPPLTVNPGEHLLLRFEFDPGWNYSGYFILKAEHSYREYHLPNSGMASAFGVGGSRMAVLSLWNTGSTPENYAFSVSGEPGNDVPHSGGFFANLYVSTLDSSALPVSLKSFFPYRAQVTSADGGTLETFRVYIPGYRATVDGHDTPVTDSKGYLASVVVPPGSHDVELRFVGTARLWLAAAVSAIGWACLIAYCGFVRLFRQDRSALLPSR
jgi:pyrimidine deaminase RibD-like protein